MKAQEHPKKKKKKDKSFSFLQRRTQINFLLYNCQAHRQLLYHEMIKPKELPQGSRHFQVANFHFKISIFIAIFSHYNNVNGCQILNSTF